MDSFAFSQQEWSLEGVLNNLEDKNAIPND
jgi:hypothetical protein